MLKALAGFGDPLNLHARLAYQALGPRGLTRWQDRFLNLGHDAPLPDRRERNTLSHR